MQTFKTAVIVVLMLTVVYGAYVSLTTPPPTVQEDFAAIMETDPAFVGDSEAAYGSLEISAGDPMDAMVDSGTAADESDPAAGPVVSTLSDTDAPPATGTSPAPAAATPLPQPPANDTPPAIDSAQQYQSTDRANFLMPDPSTLGDAMGEMAGVANVEGVRSPTNRPDPPSATTQPEKDLADSEMQLPDLDTSAGNASDIAARDATLPSAGAPREASSGNDSGNVGLANAILAADQHVEADRMKEALTTLSLFYDDPNLTDSEQEQLLRRLDPLAGAVIFSRLHLLEQPYRIEANETLMEIAANFEVPWQLLANINGIEDPVVMSPGRELKVVRGPFRAEIDLERNELTLMLGDLYAGRFPVQFGQEPAPQPGTYSVQEKRTDKAFVDASGATIPPGDARNPFGSVWLDLGQQMCIHARPETDASSVRGCIALEPADAQDVFGILSQGATVNIRR